LFDLFHSWVLFIHWLDFLLPVPTRLIFSIYWRGPMYWMRTWSIFYNNWSNKLQWMHQMSPRNVFWRDNCCVMLSMWFRQVLKHNWFERMHRLLRRQICTHWIHYVSRLRCWILLTRWIQLLFAMLNRNICTFRRRDINSVLTLFSRKLFHHGFSFMLCLSSWQDDIRTNNSLFQLFCWILFRRFSGSMYCMYGWILFGAVCWILLCLPCWNFLKYFCSCHIWGLPKLPIREIFISWTEFLLFLPGWAVH
jgi:hypothetical protein